MLKIKRRDFLKSTAALMGATAVAGSPVFNTLQRAVAAPADGGGESTVTWVPSCCQGCTTWCAIEVGVQEVNGVKRAVQVRGNQAIKAAVGGKYTGGFTCPRAILSLQEVYDPDRIKVPMKRTNPEKGKGIDPGFVPITWDEAITEIATTMLTYRGTDAASSLSHTLAVFRGRYTGNNYPIYDALSKVYGSPNNLSHSTMCAEAEKMAWYNADGAFGYHDYDIDNTKFMLLWGVDPTQSNRQVPAMINQFGELAARGVKVATVDPKLTSAAAKADYWLPVNPGTDGALALAMAHWILVTGAWNKSFVGLADTVFTAGLPAVVGSDPELGTLGLVKWWNAELFDRTPEWAEGVTGVPAATIKTVAEEFAAAGGEAISWVGPGMTMQPRGVYGGWAAAALNGLVGSFDHKGGVLPSVGASISPGVKALPVYTASHQDAISTSGAGKKKVWYFESPNTKAPLAEPQMTSSGVGGGKATNRVADAINAGTPYPINMIVSYWSNFAFSAVGSSRWEAALAKVPFHVHIGTNPCETSWFANIVLPADHHIYENWSHSGTFQRGVAHVSIQQEMITKPWDSKDAETEFIWLLAKKMYDLGQPGEPFAGQTGTNLLWDYVTQASFNDPLTGLAATTPDEFNEACAKIALLGNVAGDKQAEWDRLKVEGARWAQRNDATYYNANGEGPKWVAALTGGAAGFGTVSKRIELCNETTSKLRDFLNVHNTNHGGAHTDAELFTAINYPAAAAGKTGADGSPVGASVYGFMPHYEEPAHIGDAAEYPFRYVDFKSRLNREGRSANTPWYLEFKSNDPGDERNRDVVLMNPLDVESLGLRDGQAVRVVSPSSGKVGERCFVKAFEGVRPGTVAKAFGQGHWAYGRNASALFGEVGRGASGNSILPEAMERFTGAAARNGSTRVKVLPG